MLTQAGKLSGVFKVSTLSLSFCFLAAYPIHANNRSPQTMQEFWQTYQSQISSNPQLRQQFDRLCQQKDCDLSRLYWHTDLQSAIAEAQRSNKPILSLRLLGNLTDDFSCANSRFFRTALYPDPSISEFLRENYILHWQSERPVPRVSIDFGDGRRIERTLTGNSIHYILDNQGRPIEALPGLYSPPQFLSQIRQAKSLYDQLSQQPQRQEYLQNYHRQRLTALTQKWNSELARLGIPPQPLNANNLIREANPSAMEAGRLALTKMMVEMPTLERTNLRTPPQPTTTGLADRLTPQQWLAMANRNPLALHLRSLQLMRRLLPHNIAEASFLRIVNNFSQAIAIDSLRNEYLLHSQIHNWFANGVSISSLDTLNRRVYDELFLTPASDPWLGLVPQDVYTGLPQ